MDLPLISVETNIKPSLSDISLNTSFGEIEKGQVNGYTEQTHITTTDGFFIDFLMQFKVMNI